MKIAYRLHRDDDLEELRQLWASETNWGTPPLEVWRRYVVSGPLGGAAIVVATDESSGRIVGQFGFVPSLVSVNGRVVSAFRPSAPIVAKETRAFRSANPLKHPAAAMYFYAVKALRERGDGLIYMVPDPRWLRFFKMFPGLQTGSFPLWQKPLPLAASLPLGPGYVAAPLERFDERVDALFHAMSAKYRCMVVRHGLALEWKVGNGDYEVLGVEREGELVGVVASRRKGDRQWLICDIVTADSGPALRATLAAACNLGDERARAADPRSPIAKAAVLLTPLMEPAARELGFQRDAYDFPLVIQVLDKSLKEELAPKYWYLSASD